MSQPLPAPGSGAVAGDERPLNPREFQLLQRLLSDPFSLPMAFKTWLVPYVETSNIRLPMSSVIGLPKALAAIPPPVLRGPYELTTAAIPPGARATAEYTHDLGHSDYMALAELEGDVNASYRVERLDDVVRFQVTNNDPGADAVVVIRFLIYTP